MAYHIEDLEHPVNCLYCGDPIPYGRPDRKFCSCACKNRWHNVRRYYPDKQRVERRVIRILEHNHSILDKLVMLGVGSLDRVTLANLGYNQDYVTSYRKSGVHHQFACFDIHYEQTPTRIKKIVRIGLEGGADGTKQQESAG